MKTLNLGCVGVRQHHEHVFDADVNVDCVATEGYRNLVIHDLNVFPYPFRDREFDVVYASHILEHLIEPQKALYETFLQFLLIARKRERNLSKVSLLGIVG